MRFYLKKTVGIGTLTAFEILEGVSPQTPVNKLVETRLVELARRTFIAVAVAEPSLTEEE